MFNLMQSIWMLSPPLFIDSPIHHQDRIALNQHSKLLQWLIHPYINVELNLHEQLKYLSAAMHVVYVFFTHENAWSSYIPHRTIPGHPNNDQKCLLLCGEDKV